MKHVHKEDKSVCQMSHCSITVLKHTHWQTNRKLFFYSVCFPQHHCLTVFPLRQCCATVDISWINVKNRELYLLLRVWALVRFFFFLLLCFVCYFPPFYSFNNRIIKKKFSSLCSNFSFKKRKNERERNCGIHLTMQWL